MNPFMNPL